MREVILKKLQFLDILLTVKHGGFPFLVFGEGIVSARLLNFVVIFEGFLKEGKQPLRVLFLDGFARLNGIDEALLVFSVVKVIVFEILHLKVDEELIASKLFFLDFFFNILLNFVINFLKNFR